MNYPEINKMNLRDTREALKLGRNMRDSVKAEFLAELDSRLAALDEHHRALLAARVQVKSLMQDSGYSRAEAIELVKGGF